MILDRDFRYGTAAGFQVRPRLTARQKDQSAGNRTREGKVVFFIKDPSFHINHVPIYLSISYHGKTKKEETVPHRFQTLKISEFHGIVSSFYLTPKSANWRIALVLP